MEGRGEGGRKDALMQKKNNGEWEGDKIMEVIQNW
jgi:hypothetical protein